MISGITSVGRPERGALHVDVRPRLNSFKMYTVQLYTVANAVQMNIIQLGFDFFRR